MREGGRSGDGAAMVSEDELFILRVVSFPPFPVNSKEEVEVSSLGLMGVLILPVSFAPCMVLFGSRFDEGA